MNRQKFASILLGLLLTYNGFAHPDDSPNADIWSKGFVKRLDFGDLKTALAHPLYPPTIEFFAVCWNRSEFYASADYHNLTSGSVRIEGREISSDTGESQRFFPYATLEVSDSKDGEWKSIGNSPSITRGVAATRTMAPNSLRDNVYHRDTNPSCYFEMEAFRPLIGKVSYGRIVLKNGDISQILALSDLLPQREEDSLKAK